jgi:hypothetical protein
MIPRILTIFIMISLENQGCYRLYRIGRIVIDPE